VSPAEGNLVDTERDQAGLRRTGSLYVEHNYKPTLQGSRRTASTLTLRELRNRIEEKTRITMARTQPASKSSQLLFNKAPDFDYAILETKTGEILTASKHGDLWKAEKTPHQME